MNKGPLALRTISEAAEHIGVQQHVLRFWETKFPFIRPTKRAGGRRFYRPQDIELLAGIKTLLYDRGYTIRGVQKLFKDEGQKAILGARDRASMPTESGLVPEDEVPADYLEEVEHTQPDHGLAPRSGMSEETRQRLLEIARALEEAQVALGRHIAR